jgi:hypothetical protein
MSGRIIPTTAACPGKFKKTEVCKHAPRSRKAIVIRMVLSCCCSVPRLFAQSGTGGIEHSDRLRGTVVNSVTHESISRALVYSPDNRFATMTDRQGHFEFEFTESTSGQSTRLANDSNASPIETFGLQRVSTNRPMTLMARKIGFLPPNDGQGGSVIGQEQHEVTISLVPEAFIVGHVIVPGSDGSDRIQVELYRRQAREGREHWDSAGNAMCRSNGEFRFAELPAGSYKLFTHEVLDRDPLAFNPRRQLFGYPPVYYSAAPDFATATVIRLSPGATFQANISPVKREYYPVKIKVANAAADAGYGIQVWPQGHPSPGYSLGYNGDDGLIEGLLPDGSYTVGINAYGPNAMTGTLNFTIGGGAFSGPVVALLPANSIAVNVKEEFQSTQVASMETTIATGSNTFRASQRRPNYLGVTLVPDEEFSPTQGASLRPPAGPEDESLVIENVQPGRYRVNVNAGIGYASSVTSGGTDLLRQPLVVGLGGATPRIEITVRDDGAEVEGTIDRTKSSVLRGAGIDSTGQSQYVVYFVPVSDSSGQFRQAWVSPDGKFQLQQLPPGVYRVLAFDRQQPELEYMSDEVIGQYDSKAKVIQVLAGQKEQLRLSLITAGE